MAARRLGSESTVPNTPLQSSIRYRHQHVTANGSANEEARLPSGRCNFTNLSVGGNAPRCGCRRFWDKALSSQSGGGESARSGFCMCEHHACYHDDVPERYTLTPTPRTSNSNEVVMSDGSSMVQNTHLRQPTEQALIRDKREETDRLQESTIPDTALWGRYVNSTSNMSLPAIPSQCLLPSENSSLMSGCGSSYLKPFGGLGLRALSHIPTPAAARAPNSGLAEAQPPPKRPMQIYEDADGNGHLQSLTEVATPSARTSQDPAEDLGRNIASVQEALDRYAQGRAQTEVALRPVSKCESVHVKQSGSGPRMDSLVLHDPNEENLLPRIKHVMGQLMDYPTKIQNHEHRLDQLENASFSNGHIDDLRDDHDRIDNRVSELEERMQDLDRQMTAINDGSISSRPHANASFDERASVSSSAMDRVDASRVEALEAHVAELQASALPSHSRPWEVEVVFLPFGSRLMGIWSAQHGMSQRSRLGSMATDDWTQTPNSMAAAQAALTAHDRSSAWERSATDLADEEGNTWLMATACGLRSRVDERLRSRGLVKLIQVFGPEARDVQAAIMKAFGDLPDILAEDPYTQHDENSGSVPKTLKIYLGLSSQWIPLRKVHKNSCLRFLNPSEMITPALWRVPFLSSSVAMRHTKVRRLYVTHRDSYIQHLTRETTDWTWQKLRQLPRVYPDQPSFSHTPEADAHEPCWEFDERLDPPHESIHSSFASHISSLSIRSARTHSPEAEGEDIEPEPASQSDHFSSAAVSPNASTTPTSVAPPPGQPLSPLKERNPFRPIHGRTISMPSLIPIKPSHLSNKRRITSFDPEQELDNHPHPHPHSSPSRTLSISAQAQAQVQALQLKRRRTRSPSKDVGGAGAGPRWSVGPPSPYTFVDELGMRETFGVREGKGKERERERGMTPFAYATPHSNAPYIERDRERSGGPISVYEDESAASDENFDGEGEGSGTDEVDAAERERFQANMAMGFSGEFENYDDDNGNGDEEEEGEFGDDESIDLDKSLAFAQDRQLDEEWEGVQDKDEESYGIAIGGVVEDQDENEDDRGSENSSVPSEYPSTQQQLVHQRPEFGLFAEDKPGFMIHVDEDGDDELV